MKKLLLIIGIGLLSVVGYGQAPTIACAGATLLTVGGACGTGTISDATVADAAAPSCGAALRDGWFRFVATGTSIDIIGSTTNRQLLLQAFAACGGAEIGCSNANTTAGAQTELLSLTGLTIGNTYYIRVVNETASNMTLTSLCVTIPPLTIGTGTSSTSAYPYQGYYHDARSQFIVTASELIAAGFCSGSSLTSLAFNVETKYSTQPYSGFTIQIGHTTSSNFASAAWLTPAWTNCYNANWTTATGWNTHSFSTNFVWNGVDNIVIQTCFNNTSYTDYEYIYYTTTPDYKVCYAEMDAATGCTLAAESRSYSRPNMRFNYTVGATCSAAPAAGTAVATPNSINCTVTSSVISATGLSSNCGITYQWQSAPAAGGPWSNIAGATSTTYTASPSSNTYYRIVSTCPTGPWSATSSSVLLSSTFSPPANDDPCNATLVTVNADLACGTVSAGTVSCAGNSGIAACAGSGADDDVWYKFVATSTVHNFDVLNVSGSVTDMVHEIFSGACGALSSVGCSDPNSSQFSGFTIGVTYYVRVYTYTSTGGQNTTFNLCIGTPPPPPSNDEPCGAIDLNVNIGSCAFQSADLGTTSTISTGMPAPGCSSLGPDVWFKVTVPAGGLIIDLSPNGGPTDFGMAWYTGPSCNNLTALVECDDDDSQNGSMPMICRTGASCTVPGDCAQNAKLATGTVVYVRVWEYGGGSFGPFDICAYEPAPAGAPSNCGSATTIASLPFTNSGQTTCCRVNSYTASQGCASAYQDGEDFLYAYTPAANQTIDITLTGTLSYTGIFVTDRCPSAGGVVCVGQATSSSGNPTLCGVNLVGGTTYYIMVDTDPSPTCTPFNISVTSSSSPTCNLNYTSSVIAYAPDLNAGTNIALPIDDRFSSSYVPIGFTFCFDGFGFSQALLSSNGYLIFDPISCASNLPSANASPGAYSAYSISAAIPNTTNAPRNAILFPWQDINPAIGGTIRYQTLGTAPNRRFVITFDQIPYYSCTTLKFTGQLKIFETTNTIEMHIAKKEICAGWNGGDGIMGLHNYNGTVAVTNAAYNYPTNYTLTNQAFRFTSNCGPACIILPVKLMSFSVNSDNSFNVLNWSTATEVNNDYFIVEYSTDMVNFYELGKVDGAGNSNVVKNYQFIDNTIYDEVVYYRLRQVDFDGVYTYSDIVAVKKMEEGEISIYPNPAKEALFLDINSKKEEQFTIRFVNVLGAVVQENIVINKGTNTYQSKEFKQLQTGIYFVQLLNAKNETVKTLKIVKE